LSEACLFALEYLRGFLRPLVGIDRAKPWFSPDSTSELGFEPTSVLERLLAFIGQKWLREGSGDHSLNYAVVAYFRV
jgi:hypothetical protein